VTKTQETLRAILTDGSRQEREAAVKEIALIPPPQRNRETWIALGLEVGRLKADNRVRKRALITGDPVDPPSDEGEPLFQLIDLLTESQDPIVLPALVQCIGNGNRAMDAVAAFGEQAVANVIAMSSDDPSAALRVLTKMLEKSTRHPLSTASRRQVIEIARQRLSDAREPAPFLTAIDLAVATGDISLIQRVQSFASNEATIRATGLSDSELVTFARKRAIAALASHGIVAR
jgi:hypothetical protein